MQALKQWYAQQSERDQYMLKVGLIGLVIACFYWGIWQPIHASVERAEQRNQAQQSLATWVAQQRNKAQTLVATNRATATLQGDMVPVINRTASQFDVAFSRIQPRGDEVQVWIDEIAFNTFIIWLNALEEQGIKVLQIDVTETAQVGIVKVRRFELGK